jgi:3-oxoadipate enol-lactonase
VSLALHHERRGPPDGRGVLFAGSLGTSLAMWEPQWPLARMREMIAFDHRGHGRSPVPSDPFTIADMGADVLALLDHLELAHVSYVGLSLGGMVGMWLAAHAPDRIDRLVLICTAAHFPDPSVYADRARMVRAAGSTDPVGGVVAQRWLTPDFVAARPEVHDALVAQVLGTSADGYAGCCEAIAAMDLRSELALIAAPTLIISGAEDQATPVALQEELAARIPEARHVVVENAAHLVSVQQPEAVNALILEHLDAH